MKTTTHSLLRKIFAATLMVVLLVTSALPAVAASTPQLLKDINTEGKDSDFFDEDSSLPVVLNGYAYYVVDTPEYGDELWKTNGTEAGTVLVKDINEGEDGSYPYGMKVYNNKVVFAAYHPDYGDELWITDGTEAGTELLKDTYPGSDDADVDSPFIEMGGLLYFVADNENGRESIWKTDGTTVGTELVLDVETEIGSDDYYIDLMGANSTKLFVYVYDYNIGYSSQLAVFNGTTFEWVTDVNDVPITDIGDDDDNLATIGENVILEVCTNSEGCEPWLYNDTTGDAELLLDIDGTSDDSSIDNFHTVGSVVYFEACSDSYEDCEPWVTDGTTLGTIQLVDIRTGSSSSYPDYLSSDGTKLYFSARGDTDYEQLWVTDGTPGGTTLVYELDEYETDAGIDDDREATLVANGRLYFKLCTEDYGCELYITNADDTGVIRVKDIEVGSGGSSADYFADLGNGQVVFTADEPTYGDELWVTDGTENGTLFVKDLTVGTIGSEPGGAVLIGSKIIFAAYSSEYGEELWVTDGTTGGTVLLKDIYPGSNSSDPYNMYSYNGKVYFSAISETVGRELWVTDGTENGTVMVKDINSGINWSDPYNFIGFKDKVYFQLWNSSGGYYELWVTDGTEAGTELAAVLDENSYSFFDRMYVVGDYLYFNAYVSATGHELWKSDGTQAGTVLVKDIYPGSSSSYPQSFVVVNDSTIYFSAQDPDNGRELWKSDGTEAGTVMVKDIEPGSGDSNINYIVNVGDEIYFDAYNSETEKEFWKSDGTEAGTVLVKDINPSGSSYPESLTVHGSEIYFAAQDGTNGEELWKSDGTETGTVLVKNIALGSNDSYIDNMRSLGAYVYFSARDIDDNYELWVSDGTESGTTMVGDIYEGKNGSYPYEMMLLGDAIFFFAQDVEHGDEPFILGDVDITPPGNSGCTNSSATNYDAQATVDDGSCVLPTTQTIVSSGGGRPWVPSRSSTNASSTAPAPTDTTTCPADQLLTQNLRAPSRNGRFNSYTKGIVREAKILQAHLNRLGFNSGPVDGILGRLSDGAIKRMQTYLGTKADGFVGPKTRALINNSCGDRGLQKTL